jgi:hypothetical protein
LNKRFQSLTALLILSLLLAACSSAPYREQAIKPIWLQQNLHESWQQSHRNFIGFPTPEAFSVCHDLSCRSVSNTHLTAAEWEQIESLFMPASDNAEQERQQIKQAIALLETLVGRKTGTDKDNGRNVLQGSRIGQLDCIDEATNTAVYLRMLDSEGLLRWHQAGPRTSRGLFTGRAPHNTATIIESETGERYAVDAWFFDNGEPPAIVPLNTWKQGWRPDDVDS